MLILIAGLALAQPPGPRPWMGGQDFDRPPQEMLEGFRLFKLTEELGLSEEQTAKIYPLLAEMNKQRDEHREAMREKMKQLRDLVDGDKSDTRKAAKLAMEIHDLHMEMFKGKHAKQGQLLDLLDDGQKAKYILFDQMFERHLKDVKERMHERFGGKGPGARGGAPGGGPGCCTDGGPWGGPRGPRGPRGK